MIPYDEFAYFDENAQEFGLPWHGAPTVARRHVDVAGRAMSALVWGAAAPQLVLLHGGGQNAHTWDTVALALGVDLIALDLPGHGHSAGALRGAVNPVVNATDVRAVIDALAGGPVHLVGMSLGGLTALALADAAPELVRSLMLVDITPGVDRAKSSAIAAFVNGPATFADFDELLERTIRFNPTRSVNALRRGILHNAVQLDDGSWRWRYSRLDGEGDRVAFATLWDAVSRLKAPLCLARGMRAQSVVDDADEAELRRRAPKARIEHFADAGHSLQGDTPVELARLIADFSGLGSESASS